MAGRFISTTYTNTVNGVTDFSKATLNNDFYYLNTQGRGTKVTFFNINTQKSTLDPGSKLIQSELGEQTPLRFDKINNLFIYNFNRNEINFNNDEFGLESAPITGESYILPNVIEPIDGSFFIVDHSENNFLYKVTDVDRDTLSNGHNVWKITWVLDRVTDKEILQNVVGEYEYIDAISGNNIKPVVESSKYKKAIKLENILESLSNYFKDLFYNEYTQTFGYKWYNEYNMYDPYIIEFIIKHKLLSGASEYMHIDHMCTLPATFGIDYTKSVFNAFEKRDKKLLLGCNRTAQANLITDATSIFATRYENYFCLDYNVINEANGPFNPRGIIPIMRDELVDNILNNFYYKPDDHDNAYKNIFVKFFNRNEILDIDLENLQYIQYSKSNECFYELIMIIYILQVTEKELLT